MKLKNNILISILFICTLQMSANTKQINSTIENNYYIPHKVEKKSFWQEYIIPQAASIIALLSLIFGWYKLNKQLKSTQKEILQRYNLERTSLLLENISNLLLEINQDNGNFVNGKYISNNHFLYEKRIYLLLDLNNDLEKKLSEYIYSISNNKTNQQTRQDAIQEIEHMANMIINKRVFRI